MLSHLPGTNALAVQGHRPSLPAGLRIYAFGDIHGRLDLLERLLFRVDNDIAQRPAIRPIFVFLGDYIDRGPSSRETIEFLLARRELNECVFLKGNHEQIAVNCLNNPRVFNQWLRLGGIETLASYGLRLGRLTSRTKVAELQAAFHRALPRAHLDFFRDQQTSFACGDFYFAHAGVKPHVELSRQTENDLLWIRDEFLASTEDFGKIVVHGHTPAHTVEIRPNRINIDTGAYATGRLTCLVIDGSSLAFIDTLTERSDPALTSCAGEP
jgi:serine/threonine protein phosphatase 1